MPDIAPSNSPDISLQSYVNGVMQGSIRPYLAQGTTNSSGVATLWITDNGTSTGNPVFTQVFMQGFVAQMYGSASNYQAYNPTVSSDLKSITLQVNQLGSVILGLVNVTSAAANVDVRAVIMGK